MKMVASQILWRPVFFSLVVMLLLGIRITQADEIINWNAQLLNAVRATNTNPPIASRAMAMTHTAIFDAVNSIQPRYKPYHFFSAVASSTSQEAAAAQAGHDVLLSLFPSQSASLATALNNSLAAIPDGANKTQGVQVGASAASAIITLRANDVANEVVPYTPGTEAGQWRPTSPSNSPALLPNWPNVTPWTMTSGDQFRHPFGPPALDSPEYVSALSEVRLLGASDSAIRTADQTVIALFWADGANTATPPGHWNRIAQQVVADEGLSLVDSARTFALLNLAGADAAISSWDNKYTYDFWRPITAIHENATNPDPSWNSLIDSPPFPGYTSGHSTFSGATSAVLIAIFGDVTSFSSSQDDNPLIQRSFTSFSQAANEAADSRLFGGIHFRFENEDGLVAGQAIGNNVFQNYLTPIPEPASGIAMGLVLTVICLANRRRYLNL